MKMLIKKNIAGHLLLMLISCFTSAWPDTPAASSTATSSALDPSVAQTPEQWRPLDLMKWPTRFLNEFSAPITTNARYIFIGSMASAGMVYLSRGQRTYNKRETFHDARPLGKFGFIGETIGWGYLNGIYVVAQFSYGHFHDSAENLRASEHMFKASLYTLLVTGALKFAVPERRPGYPESRDSFPSGHASMSFAFASVVAARHGWAYGAMAYGAATYISVSRVDDDWHYLHDVLIGMGIGASYGWGLKYLYDTKLPYQFAMLPLRGGGYGQLSYDF